MRSIQVFLSLSEKELGLINEAETEELDSLSAKFERALVDEETIEDLREEIRRLEELKRRSKK